MAVITSKLIISLIDQVTAPARGVAASIKQLEGASRANAMRMNEMRGKMVDAAAAAYAVGRALADPVGRAVEFESAMADVAKVSAFSPEGLQAFSRDLRKLSTSEIPMAVTELAALAESAAASGVADTDLVDFTRMTAKAALAWGVTGGQAGEDLAKIREALRLTNQETMLYADAINHLSDNTASTGPDLTQFSRDVAAQGEFYGFTKEQTLAFGSAMISAGADTEVAATSFRNMGRALTKGDSATKRVQEAYRTLGLNASKVSQNMQEDAVGTTLEVIKRLGQLPEHMQAAVSSDLFGDEARALSPLLGDLGLLEKSLGYVSDQTEYAGSVQREFEKRAATSEFNLQRLKNQVSDVSLSIGNALIPAVNAFAHAVGPMLQLLSDWISANPQIVQAVTALVAGVVALRVAAVASRFAWLFMGGTILDGALGFAKAGGAMLSLLNPLNLVKAALVALRFAVISTGIGALVVGIAMAGAWIYQNWDGLVAFFQGFGTGVMAALAPVMPVIQPIIDTGKQIFDWLVSLTGPIDASEADWTAWGVAVGAAVGGAVTWVVTKGQEIIQWFAELPGKIAESVSGFADMGLQLCTDLLSGVQSGAQAVLDFYRSLWSDIIASVTGMDELGTGMISKLLAGVQTGAQAVLDFYIELWGKIIDSVTGMDGVGAGMIRDILAGLVSTFQELLTWFASWPQLILDAIGSIDVGSLFKMPDIGGWFGGGGETAPAVDGARAAGGAVLGGSTYLVGEEGPELVTPSRSSFVHDAGSTASALGGGGGGIGGVTLKIDSIVVQGASDPQATAESVLALIEARIKDQLAGIFADTAYGG